MAYSNSLYSDSGDTRRIPKRPDLTSEENRRYPKARTLLVDVRGELPTSKATLHYASLCLF